MKEYTYIYIVTNIFSTYILYEFMRLFNKQDKDKRLREILSYLAYFTAITAVFLIFDVPILNLITNVIFLFLISLNYKSRLIRKIISVIFMIVIFSLFEILVALVFGKSNFQVAHHDKQFTSSMSMVVVRICSFIFVLILKVFNNLTNDVEMKKGFWCAMLLVPLVSLVLIVFILQNSNIDRTTVVTCAFSLIFINVTVIFLYDIIIDFYGYKLERDIFSIRNNNYITQFKMIRESSEEIRMIEHDMKKHLNTIYKYVKNNENKKAEKYLSGLINVVDESQNVMSTGNITIDSILNTKLYESRSKDIVIHPEVLVPKQLNISDMDLTVILGNLLDNAITSVNRMEKNRIVYVKITWNKGILFICVKNKHAGEVLVKNGEIISTKSKKNNSGYGIKIVKKTIEKYNGYMEIEHQNHIFETNIGIYDVNPKE